MDIVYTNGRNEDFANLSMCLDQYLNGVIGKEKQEENYNKYNALDGIDDVIMLYENKNPVGCAAFKEYEEGVAEVKRVFVKENYRGKKLGKLLIKNIEEKALEKGYKELILETGKKLLGAIHLYNSCGYEVIPNYGQYENLKESVCMKKRI